MNDSDKRMAELLLTASLQIKDGLHQTVVVLNMASQSMPEFKSVAENYQTIESELSKAIDTLKKMI